jgi:hypothetical protein
MPQPHFLDPTRRVLTPITGPAQLETNCGTFELDQTKPGSQDFTVYRDGATYRLLRREDTGAFPFVRVPPVCTLTTLTFTATTTTGMVNDTSPEQFVRHIGHLTF